MTAAGISTALGLSFDGQTEIRGVQWHLDDVDVVEPFSTVVARYADELPAVLARHGLQPVGQALWSTRVDDYGEHYLTALTDARPAGPR